MRWLALSSVPDTIGDIICGKRNEADRPMRAPKVPQP